MKMSLEYLMITYILHFSHLLLFTLSIKLLSFDWIREV
jgi:hypothetical protein